MITIKIYKAKVSDAQEIKKLEAKVWGEEVVNKYDEPMFIRFDWCFIAKEKEKIIGAIIAFLTKDDEVFISDWVVDKLYRRENIGLLLYKKLIKAVKGKNVISLIDPENIPALTAHEKLGFKKEKIIKDAYGLHRGLEAGNRVLVRLKN